MDMYYCVLRVNNLVAMATVYMVNIVNKLPKSEEKIHSISHFYTIDHRMTNLVCMCIVDLQQLLLELFKTAILSNIWLTMATTHRVNFMGKVHLPLPFPQY